MSFLVKKHHHIFTLLIKIPIKQHRYLWSSLLQLLCAESATWKYYHSIMMTGQVVLRPSFLLSSQFLLCSCAHLWATDPSSCAKKYPVALSVHVTVQTRAADGSTCARVTRQRDSFFSSSSPFSKGHCQGYSLHNTTWHDLPDSQATTSIHTLSWKVKLYLNTGGNPTPCIICWMNGERKRGGGEHKPLRVYSTQSIRAMGGGELSVGSMPAGSWEWASL